VGRRPRPTQFHLGKGSTVAKRKGGKGKDTPEQQALPAPIVMTLAADVVITSKAVGTAAPYSWSKDGAAASSAQWSLPAYAYDVALDWRMEASGTTIPVSAGGSNAAWTWTTAAQSGFNGGVWVDDGDGTFSFTYQPPVKRITHSTTGLPWDVRYHGSGSVAAEYPITLKAGSTCTLTAVPAAAPPIHTINTVTADSFVVTWAWGTGERRDIEINGTITHNAVQPAVTVTGLTPSTQYSVRTRLDEPESAWTAAVVTTTLAAALSPHRFPAISINPDSVKIDWDGGGNRDVEFDGTVVKTNVAAGTWIEDLTPATLYSTRTRTPGGSDWTAVVQVTTDPLPSPPPLHTIDSVDHDSFRVKWDSFPTRDIELDGTVVQTDVAGNPGYTFTGRTPQTTYSVRTRQNSPPSQWTTPVTVTTGVLLSVPVVTGTPTDTAITASWEPVPNATEYYADLWDVTANQAAPGGQKAIRVSPYEYTGLTPSSAYELTVEADAPNSANVAQRVSVTTLEAEGPPPIEPSPPPTKHPEALPMTYQATPVAPITTGLYEAVTWAEGERFAIAGVEIWPYNVGADVLLWDIGWCEDVPDGTTKDPNPREEPLPPFMPMVPYAVDECGMSAANRAEVPARARHQLALLEQVRVEAEFAERLLTEVPPPSGPFDFLAAVGELEAELAARGLRGWIHASPKFAALAREANLIVGTNGTPLGHVWVFGGGYVDVLGDTLVATTEPIGWRSDVTVNTVEDHQHNRVYSVAERTVVVGYEAVLLGVNVTPAAVARSTGTKSEPAKARN
jgi:hypothetical protein